jgi:predicted transcriptional regulator
MTREQIEKQIYELARRYVESRDKIIVQAICDLGRELEKMDGVKRQQFSVPAIHSPSSPFPL